MGHNDPREKWLMMLPAASLINTTSFIIIDIDKTGLQEVFVKNTEEESPAHKDEKSLRNSPLIDDALSRLL